LFVIMLCWHALGVGMPLALIVREPTPRGDPLFCTRNQLKPK